MKNAVPAVLSDGRYNVGKLIGHGGMAEVHQAFDTRLGRTVAVKIMRADFSHDPIFLSRFRREAHSIAMLNHANIVSIYDTGEEHCEDEQGNIESLPYLVMEYITGQTLRDILKVNGALNQRDSAQVMLGMLSALEYSHRMGIIHRDIKPGNIMISDQGVVKVMDFGIARALNDSATTMTQAQGVVGTAQYLSPEQARGETVDLRSDLYSAGCVLYEMLTGRPPFTGDTPVAIAYQHVSEMATPPSQLVPGLPPIWDSICAKAMAKDRNNRYATATDFRNDIVAVINGGQVSAQAFNPLQDLQRTAPTDTAATATIQPLNPAESTQSYQPFADAADVTSNTMSQRRSDRNEAAKKRKKKNIIIASICTAIAAAALIALGWIWFAGDGNTITVPTITKSMSQATAKEKIENAGLVFVPEQDTDSTLPEGTFTRQDPAGGAKVERGTEIHVWFSAGPQSLKVPQLQGLSQKEARKKLKSLGLTVGNITSEDSKDIKRNNITRTDPAAGQAITRGSTVDFYISNGMVTIPNDLIGKPAKDVEAALSNLGLSVNTQTENSDTIPKDSVSSMKPGAGTSVNQHSSVTIVISQGKPKVTLQELTGLPLASAKAQLEQAGLTVKQVLNSQTNQPTSATGATVQRVMAGDTDITKGTSNEIDKGTNVTIYVNVPQQDTTTSPSHGNNSSSTGDDYFGDTLGSSGTNTHN